jgi:hypothetical protein
MCPMGVMDRLLTLACKCCIDGAIISASILTLHGIVDSILAKASNGMVLEISR